MVNRKALKHYEYCSHCHRATEHIHHGNESLCKRCGRIFKHKLPPMALNQPTRTATTWARGLVPIKPRSRHERRETPRQEMGEHLWGER